MQTAVAPGPFPGGARYRAYGLFLKEEFGCRVYKVIVDAGFTCPNRGHTFQAWLDAVAATRGRGIHVGTHLILEFPSESRDQMLAAAAAVSGIDVVKLHHLHVNYREFHLGHNVK